MGRVKLSFPHMGTVWVPMKALCQELGIDLVIPPQNTTRTLSLGVKHAPEGLCIPFKITLGNFLEALELGADTLLQAGVPVSAAWAATPRPRNGSCGTWATSSIC